MPAVATTEPSGAISTLLSVLTGPSWTAARAGAWAGGAVGPAEGVGRVPKAMWMSAWATSPWVSRTAVRGIVTV
jgi:hypothetical protein